MMNCVNDSELRQHEDAYLDWASGASEPSDEEEEEPEDDER